MYSTSGGNPRQCHPRKDWVLQGLGLWFFFGGREGNGVTRAGGRFSGSGTLRRPLVGGERGDVVCELGHRGLCARMSCGLQSGECSLLVVFTQVPAGYRCPAAVPNIGSRSSTEWWTSAAFPDIYPRNRQTKIILVKERTTEPPPRESIGQQGK